MLPTLRLHLGMQPGCSSCCFLHLATAGLQALLQLGLFNVTLGGCLLQVLQLCHSCGMLKCELLVGLLQCPYPLLHILHTFALLSYLTLEILIGASYLPSMFCTLRSEFTHHYLAAASQLSHGQQ